MKKMTQREVLSLCLISSLCLTSLAHAQSSPSPPRPANLPIIQTTPTNSAQVTPPTTTAMQNISQVSVPCEPNGTVWKSADADAFVANTQNDCLTAAPTQSICFSRLRAFQGAPSTTNNNSCPVGYAPVLSYGQDIIDSNTGGVLVYTPKDVIPIIASADQASWYSQNGYICGPNPSAPQITPDTAQSGTCCSPVPSSNVSSHYSVGQQTYINGVFVVITNIIENYVNCFTQPHVGAPWLSCSTVAGAYYEASFTVTGYPQQCYRNAGFWPAQNNPKYNLPSGSYKYSPSITICGKTNNVWISVQPGKVPPTQQCVVP